MRPLTAASQHFETRKQDSIPQPTHVEVRPSDWSRKNQRPRTIVLLQFCVLERLHPSTSRPPSKAPHTGARNRKRTPNSTPEIGQKRQHGFDYRFPPPPSSTLDNISPYHPFRLLFLCPFSQPSLSAPHSSLVEDDVVILVSLPNVPVSYCRGRRRRRLERVVSGEFLRLREYNTPQSAFRDGVRSTSKLYGRKR